MSSGSFLSSFVISFSYWHQRQVGSKSWIQMLWKMHQSRENQLQCGCERTEEKTHPLQFMFGIKERKTHHLAMWKLSRWTPSDIFQKPPIESEQKHLVFIGFLPFYSIVHSLRLLSVNVSVVSSVFWVCSSMYVQVHYNSASLHLK